MLENRTQKKGDMNLATFAKKWVELFWGMELSWIWGALMPIFFSHTTRQIQDKLLQLRERFQLIWLVVEPTHLKNMLVKMGSSSPSFGMKIPKIFELPPTSYVLKVQEKQPWLKDTDATRWAPTSYNWSYNPYKWPYNWVTGVITPISGVITILITGRGPTLYQFAINLCFQGSFSCKEGPPIESQSKRQSPEKGIPKYMIWIPSWRLNQPLWKICASQIGFIFPK